MSPYIQKKLKDSLTMGWRLFTRGGLCFSAVSAWIILMVVNRQLLPSFWPSLRMLIGLMVAAFFVSNLPVWMTLLQFLFYPASRHPPEQRS